MRQVKLYTDGSYYKDERLKKEQVAEYKVNEYEDKIGKPGMVTHGGFVALNENDEPIVFMRINCTIDGYVKAWSNGGETIAAFMAVRWVDQYLKQQEALYGTDDVEVIIYHDYIGISEWVKPHGKTKWKAKTIGAQQYVKVVNKVFGESAYGLKFVKVEAHTGDIWNEVADSLAKGVPNKYITKEVEVVNV